MGLNPAHAVRDVVESLAKILHQDYLVIWHVMFGMIAYSLLISIFLFYTFDREIVT